jgi:putative peptide zinc metalloprotease protein
MTSPACPRLRRDLTWRRFVQEGQDAFIFKDDISQEYLKLDVISGTLALELDGTRTSDDLLALARETFPSLDFDEDYIADMLGDFRRYKLLEDPFERNALLAARAREERAQINATTFKNLLSIPFGTWNPDAFLTRTYPYVAFMFRRAFVVLGLALFLFAGYVVWLNRDRIGVPVAHSGYGAGAGIVAGFLIWLTITLAIVIHELGHGYAVKHYGGRVPRMGFILIFGTPCMFCDTSDSHLFPERVHRAHVALAGTYTELYVAAFATLVWWLTPSGLMINQIAYNIILFCSVSGILFNYNPLIKMDGYFVLADLLDLPNLQEDSFGFLGYLFKRHVLGMRIECPVEGRRRKRVLALFGSLSIVYSVLFGVLVFAFLRGFFIRYLHFFGALLAAGLLVLLLKRPVRPMARTARLWALDHRGAIRRVQLPLVAGAALAIAAFFLLPVPGTVTLEATLLPAREAALVAPDELRLRSLSFHSGDLVRAGQVLAVLDADSLAHSLDESAAEERALGVTRAAAYASGDAVEAVAARSAGAAEAARGYWLARRVARAELRAPFDGRVLTPESPGLIGECVAAGDTLCAVGDFSSLRATARAGELELEELRIGAPVRLRLLVRPGEVLRGRVSAIEGQGEEHRGERTHRVWFALEGGVRDARAGLTGCARVATIARAPASHLYRWIARFLRVDLWV